MIMSPQSLEVKKKKEEKHFFLIFIFIFETSSDCEESNVYHLKKVSVSSEGRTQLK